MPAISFPIRAAVLLVGLASSTVDQEESLQALVADDACLGGEDSSEACSLELRQLRGLKENETLATEEAFEPWAQIGPAGTQCFPAAGPDLVYAATQKDCQDIASKEKLKWYQYSEEEKLCGTTNRCSLASAVKNVKGWKSYGKGWCTECGKTSWAPNDKLRKCCKEQCAKGFYWKPWGSTVDCRGGPGAKIAAAEEQRAKPADASE